METMEERFPFLFNTKADYNTNSPSYYDGLAKYNKVLQILSKMIEEYDVKLDNSLENINTVLTNYTTMLDGKLSGFDDSVTLLLREWIDDGTFAEIINTEIFNHKLDTVTFNGYKENADSVALSFSEQLEHIEPQMDVADNFIKSQFKASDTNLLTQMQSFVDYVNASLNPLVPLVVGDLVNYLVTSTIDGSANLLLTKTGAEAFTWSLINKTQINAECTFKITNNRTYFVIAGKSTKAVAVSLAGGITDFGQIMRWNSNGASENIKSAFADQTGKGLIGDTVKVSRIVTGWKFQIKRADSSTFVDWFDVAFAQAGTNLETEFTEAEKQYGVVKYSATASENMISTVTFKNLFVLPNISIWNGKIWNAIGDSITWLNQYEPIVQSGLGLASYNNYGKSGYSTNMLKSDEATWSLSADIVTFFAGTNDFGRCDTLETTQTSVSHILNYLKTNFPSKTIVVCLPTQRWGYTGDTVRGSQATMTNSDGLTLRQYCDTIKAVADGLAIPVLDLYYLSGITKENIATYTTDGLHPNTAGMTKIANVMIDFINSL